jgi:hypothetical protein
LRTEIAGSALISPPYRYTVADDRGVTLPLRERPAGRPAMFNTRPNV